MNILCSLCSRNGCTLKGLHVTADPKGPAGIQDVFV